MSLLRAIRIKDRFGNDVFKCPLCGHIFYSSKQYTKHLTKAHLRKMPKRKRIREKILKHLYIITFKKEQGMELTRWEKVLDLKARLTGYK